MNIERKLYSIDTLHQEALEYDIAREQVLKDLDDYYFKITHTDNALEEEYSPDLSIDYEGSDIRRFANDPKVIINAIKAFVLRDVAEGYDAKGIGCMIGTYGKKIDNLPKGVFPLHEIINPDFFGEEGFVIELLKEVGCDPSYWIDDVSGPARYIFSKLKSSKTFFNKLVKVAEEGYYLSSQLFIYIRPEKIDKEILQGYKKILGGYGCYPYIFRMKPKEIEDLYNGDREFFIEFVKEVLKEYLENGDEEHICDFERYRGRDDVLDFHFTCNGYQPVHPERWVDANSFKKIAEMGLFSLKKIPIEFILQDPESADKVIERGFTRGRQDIGEYLSEELIEKCPSIVNKFLAVNPKNFIKLPVSARNSRYTQASVYKVWPEVLQYIPKLHKDFFQFAIGRDLSNPEELERFAEIILPGWYIPRLDKEETTYFVDMERYDLEQKKEKKGK